MQLKSINIEIFSQGLLNRAIYMTLITSARNASESINLILCKGVRSESSQSVKRRHINHKLILKIHRKLHVGQASANYVRTSELRIAELIGLMEK